MSSNTPNAENSTDASLDADAHITGPHYERDRHGTLTGATFYRCERCEQEALRRADLHDFGCDR